MNRHLVALALGAALLANSPALADRATILVLDASGSMWAQLAEGRSRIEVARDVLSDFLTARDAAQPLGVIAYGHNRKSDCADIEVIAPVGAQDGATLATRLRELMPQGKTPLAEALRTAGAAIPATAEEADIVLITDGLESCGGDPCAVAAGLRRQGIPVRAHVVGFGLAEGEIQQIACVADATGGQVLLAQSGNDLAAALTRVDLPPVEVALSLQPIDRTTGAALPAADWVLTDADGQETSHAEGQRTWGISVPPGDYTAAATAPGYSGTLSISVTDQVDGVIDVPLDRTHARVTLVARDQDTGAVIPDVDWVVTRSDGARVDLTFVDGVALVAPGDYRVAATAGEQTGAGDLTAELGDQTLEVTLAGPRLEATVQAVATAGAGEIILIEWTGPNDTNDFITAVPTVAPDDEHGNLARIRRGNPAQLLLPDEAGDFELRYVHAPSGKVLARTGVTLTDPVAKLQAPDAAVAGARISVTWQGPDNQNDIVTVVEAGAPDGVQGNLARTRRGNPADLLLPDALGAHELRYVVAQSERVLARRPIMLEEPSATLDAPDHAVAGARISVTWQGPDNQNDFVTVVEAGAPEGVHGNLARTRRGNPADLLLPDALGAHELRYVVAQSERVLTRRPIMLEEPSANLEDPGPILPGGRFTVNWTGPDNPNDFITVVPKGSPEDTHGQLTRTRRGNPAEMRTPDTPGEYELRYVLAQSGRVLAVLPVQVGGATVTLALDGPARLGQPIRVQWTGPGRYEDVIEILPADSVAGAKALRSARASQGNPAILSTPPVPGRYQLRYRATDSGKVLHQIEIEVGT